MILFKGKNKDFKRLLDLTEHNNNNCSEYCSLDEYDITEHYLSFYDWCYDYASYSKNNEFKPFAFYTTRSNLKSFIEKQNKNSNSVFYTG